jgi:hypothetical protein
VIIQVLKCGCRWVDAPSAYGPRKTLYNRYSSVRNQWAPEYPQIS